MQHIHNPGTLRGALTGISYLKYDFDTSRRRTSSFWAHYEKFHGKIYESSLLSTSFDSSAIGPHFDFASWDLSEGIEVIAHGRRLFIIDLGFIGLGLVVSNIGDETCLFFGGTVLYIIWREENICHFVGNAMSTVLCKERR